MAWVVGLIIPIWNGRPSSVNHRLPSEPDAIWAWSGIGDGDGELGDGVGRRVDHANLRWSPPSVNQRFPSDPTVISDGWLLAAETGNSVIDSRQRSSSPSSRNRARLRSVRSEDAAAVSARAGRA